jgi:hypothetical protein
MGALLYRLHIAFQAFAHGVTGLISFASPPRER